LLSLIVVTAIALPMKIGLISCFFRLRQFRQSILGFAQHLL